MCCPSRVFKDLKSSLITVILTAYALTDTTHGFFPRRKFGNSHSRGKQPAAALKLQCFFPRLWLERVYGQRKVLRGGNISRKVFNHDILERKQCENQGTDAVVEEQTTQRTQFCPDLSLTNGKRENACVLASCASLARKHKMSCGCVAASTSACACRFRHQQAAQDDDDTEQLQVRFLRGNCQWLEGQLDGEVRAGVWHVLPVARHVWLFPRGPVDKQRLWTELVAEHS